MAGKEGRRCSNPFDLLEKGLPTDRQEPNKKILPLGPVTKPGPSSYPRIVPVPETGLSARFELRSGALSVLHRSIVIIKQ